MILLLRFIWTFNKFDIIYLTTGGGPLGATETPPLLIYHVFFGQYVYGRASAIAVLMFLFLVATSFVYFKFYQGAYRRLQ
jgi:multiple sugar transport system permease protein